MEVFRAVVLSHSYSDRSKLRKFLILANSCYVYFSCRVEPRDGVTTCHSCLEALNLFRQSSTAVTL